ncbi:hypothetical protein K1719_026397 [Acacia pycnantha]|nr:hypothetical protein K1719_026397 [Acacia pycnantha]
MMQNPPGERHSFLQNHTVQKPKRKLSNFKLQNSSPRLRLFLEETTDETESLGPENCPCLKDKRRDKNLVKGVLSVRPTEPSINPGRTSSDQSPNTDVNRSSHTSSVLNRSAWLDQYNAEV